MMETQATRVARGSAYLVTQSLITLAVNALGFAFIARILTPMEMGIIVVLSLILSLAQVLSDLGFSSVLARDIAEGIGRNSDYTPIVFTGVLMKAFVAGFAATLCMLMAPTLSEWIFRSGEHVFLMQLLSIDLLFFCMSITMNYLLLGLNRMREMAVFNIAGAIVRQVLAVGLLAMGLGLTGLVAGWTLGDLVYLSLSIAFLARGKHAKVCKIGQSVPYLKRLAKFSWPLFLTQIVIFFYNWFDRALLLVYIPLSEVAVYNVAYQAFSVLYALPAALSTTLLPFYSERYGKNRHKEIMAGARAATRYISLFYIPFALGLAVTSNPTITLFAGSTYAAGDIILGILSIFGAIVGIGAAFGNLFLVYELTTRVLAINVASIATSLAMSPLLLPSFGAVGMAIVRGVAMTFSFILTIVLLWKRLPVSIRFDREAILKSLGAAILMVLTVGLIQHIWFSKYLLPFYVLVGGVVYLAALRILKAVNQSDMDIFRRLLGKRGSYIVNLLTRVLM